MQAARIEAKAWNDPRFAILARELRLIGPDPVKQAVGLVAYLWGLCTEEGSAVLPEAYVDAVVPVDALLRSMLAESTPEGIRLRGAEERCGWLRAKREAAKRARDAKQARGIGAYDRSLKQVGHSSVNSSDDNPGDSPGNHNKNKNKSQINETATDCEAVKGAFLRLYQASTGRVATWFPGYDEQVEHLLDALPRAEVIARMRYGFEHPPSWLKGHAVDWPTFYRHIGKFAEPQKQKRIAKKVSF